MPQSESLRLVHFKPLANASDGAAAITGQVIYVDYGCPIMGM
jgi:enoyl-[acyl-carrier-protein] reductase (NADH)